MEHRTEQARNDKTPEKLGFPAIFSDISEEKGSPSRTRTIAKNTGEIQGSHSHSASDSALSADLQRVIDSWPFLPVATRQAIFELVSCAQNDIGNGTTFAADFVAGFDRLDSQNGGRNFVNLTELRRALPAYDRATFDAGLTELRRSWRFTLSAAEGRHGISPEEQAAGIREGGALLLWVSRRQKDLNVIGDA